MLNENVGIIARDKHRRGGHNKLFSTTLFHHYSWNQFSWYTGRQNNNNNDDDDNNDDDNDDDNGDNNDNDDDDDSGLTVFQATYTIW